MAIRLKSVAAAALATALLAGCATYDRQGTADRLAAPRGMTRATIPSGPFVLTSFARLTSPGAPLRVYIEGDGLAWVDTNVVSGDPTPINPTALTMAVRDNAPNVVYLARPCQYTDRKLNPRCSELYWTDRRFSEEVVASVNGAIDNVKARSRAAAVELVGYSGGGAVAALVAARRNDVTSLRTVAGNLDHKAVNSYHKVDQQRGSLNAIDVARSLANLPQVHFYGTEDKIIPPFVSRSFVDALGGGRCARVSAVQGASHANGWAEAWPSLLATPVECRQ